MFSTGQLVLPHIELQWFKEKFAEVHGTFTQLSP